MKLAEHSNKLHSNVDRSEAQQFNIGDASIIIDILRNRLYEKKVQTTVQEYVSNGRDGCREIGQPDHAMEITVPTVLSPTFKVRDFGIGISPERMVDTFIKYGSSTKRHDNVQTGGLGIGGKSFFSLRDSFSIITYLFGIKRTYVAHIGESNAGHLDLVSTESTIEKNGTEIIGAVKSHEINEFRDAVLRVTYFWKNRPIIKGVSFVSDLISGYRIGDIEFINHNLLPSYTEGHYNREPMAIIDGIPYPIGHKLMDKCPTLTKLEYFAKQKILLHFGNGIVEVAASRESIADSPKSVAALEQIGQKAAQQVKKHISDRFKSVKTSGEFVKTYQEMDAYFHVESGFAKYGNYQINGSNLESDLFQKVKMTEIHCLGKGRRTRVEKITKVDLVDKHKRIPLELLEHVFFNSVAENKITQNKRIKTHFEKHMKMILIEEIQGNPEFAQIIKDVNAKDFQTLTFVVLPKAARVVVSRDKQEFCLHTLRYGGRFHHVTLSGNTQKWFFVPITDAGWEMPTGWDRFMLEGLDDYLRTTANTRICGVAKRSLSMIKGDTNFAPLKNYLDKYKPNKEEIKFAKRMEAKNQAVVWVLEKLKGIKDKELVDIIAEYKKFSDAGSTKHIPEALMTIAKKEKEVKDFAAQDKKVENLIKTKYPLIERYTSHDSHVQELIYYVNAKYEEKP